MPRTRRLATLAVLAVPAAFAPAAEAERFAAVDKQNRLYTFDDRKPADWKRITLRGIGAGERIVGLDVRPANRQLTALSSAGRFYVVSRNRRTATPAGNPFAPTLSGAVFGMDFNPAVDRVRVVSNTGQNLRVHPDTGAVTTDKALAYPPPGVAPVLAGSAYTNPVAGATTTTLFGIDTGIDALVTQAPPNDGVLKLNGRLGVNLVGDIGFDISARDGRAWILGRRARTPGSRLYAVDLATGRAAARGVVRGAPQLTALATLSAPRP